MKGAWSLKSLYSGFDDPRFEADYAEAKRLNEALAELAQSLGALSDADAAARAIPLLEGYEELTQRLSCFALLKNSVDTSDNESASMLSRLGLLESEPAGAISAIMRRLGEARGIEGLPCCREYGYFLACARDDAKHLLSNEAEEVAARYDVSGGSAWEDLHAYATSTVTADYRGERLNLAAVRNLAYSPDAAVRKDAYDAELACYDGIKDAGAFALNSIKLQSISECGLRGFASPLEKSLHYARMKQETLDALWSAVREYLPVFWEYYALKAEALGYGGGLKWWDMFAPLGKNDARYTADDAKEYLLRLFAGFDSELESAARRAFAEEWVDFYPRAGKVGGAFCEGIGAIGEFRILTNFDGGFGDVVTLAHELGHGYHDTLTQPNRPLNRDYSMPVAETASTFNENIVVGAALEEAGTDAERLNLIDSRLMETAQIVCDIYSRFLFEKAVCDRRADSFMFAGELCDIMREAQTAAYGTGLDAETLHPYMWLCKSHYYSSSLGFYNYPYAFGGLFARGLYEKYRAEGAAFLPKYRAMLSATPVRSVEAVAAIMDIDVTRPDFWRTSLEACRADIELFKKLIRKGEE